MRESGVVLASQRHNWKQSGCWLEMGQGMVRFVEVYVQ